MKFVLKTLTEDLCVSDACISAVQGALCSMQQSGVWIGFLWWAAGPWWGNVSAFQVLNLTARPDVLIVFPIDRASEWCGHRQDSSRGTSPVPVSRPYTVAKRVGTMKTVLVVLFF